MFNTRMYVAQSLLTTEFSAEFTPSLSEHIPMLSIYSSISINLNLDLSLFICLIHAYTAHIVYCRLHSSTSSFRV